MTSASIRLRRAAVTFAAVGGAALAIAPAAWAHAEISPPIVESHHLQFFTLAVPTEKATAQTTTVEMTPPAGFAIDSFEPSPGWKRSVQTTGSGNSAVIQKVTWSGGKVPTGEDSVFHFLADAGSNKTYTFEVRQTYSDGSVVDWAGPESSDSPAPSLKAVGSLGGGSGSTLAVVALIVAALAAVLGLVGLVSGRRPLA